VAVSDRTLEEVMAGLEPVLDPIYEIPHAALATYLRTPPDMLIDHDATAAAKIMWCHMLAEAERRFADIPRVVLKDIRGMKVWLINDTAVLRLKKLDEDGRTRNYPTPQQRDFDRGDTLPGLPSEAMRLSAGYVLDPVGRSIDWVMISRPNGKVRPHWCVAVNPPGSAVRYEVKYRSAWG
jgi:hypothetical protein